MTSTLVQSTSVPPLRPGPTDIVLSPPAPDVAAGILNANIVALITVIGGVTPITVTIVESPSKWQMGFFALLRNTSGGALVEGTQEVVTLTATDTNGHSVTKAFTINIESVPTSIDLFGINDSAGFVTVAQEAVLDDFVGTFETQDGTAPYTYSNLTNAKFAFSVQLDGSTELHVASAGVGNLVAGTQEVVGIRSTDANGAHIDASFTIDVVTPGLVRNRFSTPTDPPAQLRIEWWGKNDPTGTRAQDPSVPPTYSTKPIYNGVAGDNSSAFTRKGVFATTGPSAERKEGPAGSWKCTVIADPLSQFASLNNSLHSTLQAFNQAAIAIAPYTVYVGQPGEDLYVTTVGGVVGGKTTLLRFGFIDSSHDYSGKSCSWYGAAGMDTSVWPPRPRCHLRTNTSSTLGLTITDRTVLGTYVFDGFRLGPYQMEYDCAFFYYAGDALHAAGYYPKLIRNGNDHVNITQAGFTAIRNCWIVGSTTEGVTYGGTLQQLSRQRAVLQMINCLICKNAPAGGGSAHNIYLHAVTFYMNECFTHSSGNHPLKLEGNERADVINNAICGMVLPPDGTYPLTGPVPNTDGVSFPGYNTPAYGQSHYISSTGVMNIEQVGRSAATSDTTESTNAYYRGNKYGSSLSQSGGAVAVFQMKCRKSNGSRNHTLIPNYFKKHDDPQGSQELSAYIEFNYGRAGDLVPAGLNGSQHVVGEVVPNLSGTSVIAYPTGTTSIPVRYMGLQHGIPGGTVSMGFQKNMGSTDYSFENTVNAIDFKVILDNGTEHTSRATITASSLQTSSTGAWPGNTQATFLLETPLPSPVTSKTPTTTNRAAVCLMKRNALAVAGAENWDFPVVTADARDWHDVTSPNYYMEAIAPVDVTTGVRKLRFDRQAQRPYAPLVTYLDDNLAIPEMNSFSANGRLVSQTADSLVTFSSANGNCILTLPLAPLAFTDGSYPNATGAGSTAPDLHIFAPTPGKAVIGSHANGYHGVFNSDVIRWNAMVVRCFGLYDKHLPDFTGTNAIASEHPKSYALTNIFSTTGTDTDLGWGAPLRSGSGASAIPATNLWWLPPTGVAVDPLDGFAHARDGFNEKPANYPTQTMFEVAVGCGSGGTSLTLVDASAVAIGHHFQVEAQKLSTMRGPHAMHSGTITGKSGNVITFSGDPVPAGVTISANTVRTIVGGRGVSYPAPIAKPTGWLNPEDVA